MKLIIDIDNDYFEIIKYRVEHGDDYKPYTLIANGIPYEERPQGEWGCRKKGVHVSQYACSNCGRTVMDDTGYDVSKDYPFCHCGADMRKGGAE